MSSPRIVGHGAFVARLEEACANSLVSGRSISVLRVRATGGHRAAIERALEARATNRDVLGYEAPGRYELLLAVPDGEEARRVAVRLEAELTITGANASVGIATYGVDGTTPALLMAVAVPSVGAATEAAEPPKEPVELIGGSPSEEVVGDDAWQAERARLMSALERCAGNQTRAAKALGVSRRTIVSWMVRYRIPRPHKPLPGPLEGDGEGMDAASEAWHSERRRIMNALEQCSGNQTRAAKLLGMSRRTLVSRLISHRIPRPRKPLPG